MIRHLTITYNYHVGSCLEVKKKKCCETSRNPTGWSCSWVRSPPGCCMGIDKWITRYGDGSKPWYLVNPKIAGKWMFIPLKMVLIGIDPYPDIIINMFRSYSWKMLKVRVSNSFQTGIRFQVALPMITLDTGKVILDAKIELVTWPINTCWNLAPSDAILETGVTPMYSPLLGSFPFLNRWLSGPSPPFSWHRRHIGSQGASVASNSLALPDTGIPCNPSFTNHYAQG